MGDWRIEEIKVYIFRFFDFVIFPPPHLRITPTPHLRITLIFINILINSKRKTPITNFIFSSHNWDNYLELRSKLSSGGKL